MTSEIELSEEQVFRYLDMLSSRIARAAFNGVVYGGSLFGLGGSWRGLLVGAVAFVLYLVGYGGRWVERGGFALVAIAMLVWLGAVPEPKYWLASAESTLTRFLPAR
jgi:hypothetical protein